MNTTNQTNRAQEAVFIDTKNNENRKGKQENQEELKEKMGLNNGIRAIGGA